MSEKNWERRTLNSHGANFRLDVTNPQVTPGGEEVYSFFSVTDEGDKCAVGQDQAGKYKIHNDKTVEIVGGGNSAENGVDVIISGRGGDVVITSDGNGNISIRGKNITLQADEDIDIQAGRNVSIASGSGRTLLKGNTLEKSGLKGNLLDAAEGWAYKVFEGTGLPGGAFASLLSPFGGIAEIAASIASSPSSFGGLVGDAIGGALGAATGGLVGPGLVGDVISGNVGGLTDFAVGQAGSLLSNATGGIVGGDTIGSVISGDIGGAVSGAVSNATGNNSAVNFAVDRAIDFVEE